MFISELASNAVKILGGGSGKPDLTSLLSAPAVAALAVKRWMVPRAERRPEYKEWKVEQLFTLLAPRMHKSKLAASR